MGKRKRKVEQYAKRVRMPVEYTKRVRAVSNTRKGSDSQLKLPLAKADKKMVAVLKEAERELKEHQAEWDALTAEQKAATRRPTELPLRRQPPTTHVSERSRLLEMISAASTEALNELYQQVIGGNDRTWKHGVAELGSLLRDYLRARKLQESEKVAGKRQFTTS